MTAAEQWIQEARAKGFIIYLEQKDVSGSPGTASVRTTDDPPEAVAAAAVGPAPEPTAAPAAAPAGASVDTPSMVGVAAAVDADPHLADVAAAAASAVTPATALGGPATTGYVPMSEPALWTVDQQISNVQK